MVAQSKGESALAELDRVRAAGVRFGTVLADAGYGMSAVFRMMSYPCGIRIAQHVLRLVVRSGCPLALVARLHPGAIRCWQASA